VQQITHFLDAMTGTQGVVVGMLLGLLLGRFIKK